MKQTVNGDYRVCLTTRKPLPQVRCKAVGPEKGGQEEIKIYLHIIRKEWSCPEEEKEKEKEEE